jgi:hypothetical protein
MRRKHVALAMLLAACGGGAADPVADSAAIANKAVADSNAAKRAAALAIVMENVDTLAAGGQRPLLRETFAYTGSGRDPFRSMITVAATGPALADMVLTAVLYDERNASNSVAVFRENGSNRRFTVRPGERIGRLYVAGMTRMSATLRFDDYGTVREQTYSLRPTEDEG